MGISKFFMLLGVLFMAPSSAQHCFELSGGRDDWDVYKSRFVASDGRLIDTGNQGVSHSEGQGFGMRLAVFFDDRATFDRIWGWTQEHLYIRGDRLAAWRWRPDQSEPVDDLNNASDGDLLIAWSLSLAGRQWRDPDYRDAARAIAADIRRKLVRVDNDRPVLLPGIEGFERQDGTILNLSYWVFPALTELAKLEPDEPAWSKLTETGARLLDEARFGRWGLPPDWLARTDERLTLPADFKPRFGYDAVRIPLYLIWDRQRNQPLLSRVLAFWDTFATAPFTPDWMDLSTDAVSVNPAPVGIRAIIALTWFVVQGERDTAFLELPPLGDDADYYSASLLLMARIAASEWCRQPDQGMAPDAPHPSS